MDNFLFLADGEGVGVIIILLMNFVPICLWWKFYEKPRKEEQEVR